MSEYKIKELNSPTVNIMLPDGINVQIDPVADILYIRVRDAEVVSTREEKEGILVDFDKRGNLIGIDVLHPKRDTIERRRIFKRMAKRFHVPTISRIRPDYLAKGYEHKLAA